MDRIFLSSPVVLSRAVSSGWSVSNYRCERGHQWECHTPHAFTALSQEIALWWSVSSERKKFDFVDLLHGQFSLLFFFFGQMYCMWRFGQFYNSKQIWLSHEAHLKIRDCFIVSIKFLKDRRWIFLRLTVFSFSDNFSKVCLTYLVRLSAGGLLQVFPPDFVSSVSAPLIPRLFRGLSKTTGGSRRKTEQRHLFPAILPPSMATSCLLAVQSEWGCG